MSNDNSPTTLLYQKSLRNKHLSAAHPTRWRYPLFTELDGGGGGGYPHLLHRAVTPRWIHSNALNALNTPLWGPLPPPLSFHHNILQQLVALSYFELNRIWSQCYATSTPTTTWPEEVGKACKKTFVVVEFDKWKYTTYICGFFKEYLTIVNWIAGIIITTSVIEVYPVQKIWNSQNQF